MAEQFFADRLELFGESCALKIDDGPSVSYREVAERTDRAAVIHESERLPGLGVDADRPVLIDYQHEQATVRALQVQEHVRELAEMELGG